MSSTTALKPRCYQNSTGICETKDAVSYKDTMSNCWWTRIAEKDPGNILRYSPQQRTMFSSKTLLRSWIMLSLYVVCAFSATDPHHFPTFLYQDPCYDADGDPIKCEPEFVNPVFQLPLKVSDTCGHPKPSVLCRSVEKDGGQSRLCELCQNVGASSHPVRYLTDLHNPNNVTCWYSNKLPLNERGVRQNVTLIIPLRKMYDVSYIVLRFCTSRPETMMIYKSKDHGKTWIPYQYYSKRCRQVFNMTPRPLNSKLADFEAICTDVNSDHLPYTNGDVSFYIRDSKTVLGNPSLEARMQDWSSATDIKIVLINVYDNDPKSFGISSLTHDQDVMLKAYLPNINSGNGRLYRTNSNSGVSSGLFYGISDIRMGARCTCHGHGSECVHVNGKLSCVCKHNTEGTDCQRCKPFHSDRPWMAATETNANECVACNCNLHAKKCRFNMQLYILSGKKTGGVCVNCRHNTAGRNCHYCKEGYYRNSRKPITHKRACKACNCHKYGATGRTCNQTTGQCPCKDGVTGLSCDRCKAGFQQSRSRIAPCIRPNERGEHCHSKCKSMTSRRINLKRFCKRDFVLQAQTLESTDSGEWTWFSLNVISVYKTPNVDKLTHGQHRIRVRTRDVSCMCPKIRENRKYIIMGSYDRAKSILSVDMRSLVLPWKDSYRKKLLRMMGKWRNGKC